MHSLALSAAGLSLLATAVRANAAVDVASDTPRRDTTKCDDVHIFLARGNNEPYPGRQSNLVEAVCENLSGCDYEDLIYNAAYSALYCQTVYDGVVAGHVQMAEYANRCPDSKIVLGGYSQGAQIITDILGGAGGTLYNGCVQPDVAALSRDNAPGNMGKWAQSYAVGFIRPCPADPREPTKQSPPPSSLATSATRPASRTTTPAAPASTASTRATATSCRRWTTGPTCCATGATTRTPCAPPTRPTRPRRRTWRTLTWTARPPPRGSGPSPR